MRGERKKEGKERRGEEEVVGEERIGQIPLLGVLLQSTQGILGSVEERKREE